MNDFLNGMMFGTIGSIPGLLLLTLTNKTVSNRINKSYSNLNGKELHNIYIKGTRLIFFGFIFSLFLIIIGILIALVYLAQKPTNSITFISYVTGLVEVVLLVLLENYRSSRKKGLKSKNSHEGNLMPIEVNGEHEAKK